jgi:hypothetical protein
VKNRDQGITGQNVRNLLIESNTALVFTDAGAIDVYESIIIREGAYGIPDIQVSSNPDIFVKNSEVDSADTSNPMNLY